MIAARNFFETPATQITPEEEEAFFSSLMTRNKTYKTTFRQRFSDINPYIVAQLQQRATQPVHVLDIGISSGVSTLELYDDIRAVGLDASIIATDILVDAFLVRVLPKCHVLMDSSGFPLRFDLPWASMRPWVARSDYRNGLFVLRKSTAVTLGHLAKRILRNPNDRRVTRVKLVTPRLSTSKDIVVCNDDIREKNGKFEGEFDFIRAANILNKGYFSEDLLGSMVANAVSYLRQSSGILLVVRTHGDRSNHGTAFHVGKNHRLEVMCRFGRGSEVEDIVLRCEL